MTTTHFKRPSHDSNVIKSHLHIAHAKLQLESTIFKVFKVDTTLKWMLESTMKWMLESTLFIVENFNQGEVRIQADSSTLSC